MTSRYAHAKQLKRHRGRARRMPRIMTNREVNTVIAEELACQSLADDCARHIGGQKHHGAHQLADLARVCWTIVGVSASLRCPTGKTLTSFDQCGFIKL